MDALVVQGLKNSSADPGTLGAKTILLAPKIYAHEDNDHILSENLKQILLAITWL